MNRDKVYDPDTDTLSLNRDEHELLDQLRKHPVVYYSELIEKYLSGSDKQNLEKYERLHEILMFHRNQVGSREHFTFSRDLADTALEKLYKYRAKVRKGRRQQINSLEELFTTAGDVNAKLFREMIIQNLLIKQDEDTLIEYWQQNLKEIIFILCENNIFKTKHNRRASSPTLSHVFNKELKRFSIKLHDQAFQKSKMPSRVQNDATSKIIAIPWVRK